jgi:hypothetical protein
LATAPGDRGRLGALALARSRPQADIRLCRGAEILRAIATMTEIY